MSKLTVRMTVHLNEETKRALDTVAAQKDREPAWLARKYILDGLKRDQSYGARKSAKK